MSKFKIGDRVRIIHTHYNSHKLGDVGIISNN